MQVLHNYIFKSLHYILRMKKTVLLLGDILQDKLDYYFSHSFLNFYLVISSGPLGKLLPYLSSRPFPSVNKAFETNLNETNPAS